ncbi:spore cortex biosynthesis protein YabQ [Salibacterium aidingense]|uniref:spore cortex biosynthesis protein YabQ n=1 Tax=Salibacterium aidingense TaxID=384933 RepID=UPI003BE0C82B
MSLAVQFQTMAAMIMMGIIIGVNMDVYERITLQTFRRLWVRAGGDVLFWIVQALLVFYVLLRVNEGELRLYIFAGLAAGFLLYRHLGRPSFLVGLEHVLTAVRWLIRFIIAVIQVLLIHPVKFILKLTASSVMIGLTIIKKILSLILRVLLFPLTWTARAAAPMIKRILPLPILIFIRKTADVLTRLLKD